MAAPPTISAIGSAFGRKFIAHEMPAAGTAMATPAKNPDIIYEV